MSHDAQARHEAEESDRRAASAPRPDHGAAHGPARGDPHASPLGRKTRIGPQPDTYPLRSASGSTAGARSHATPGEGADPSDALTKANADATPQSRRAATAGIQSETHETAR